MDTCCSHMTCTVFFSLDGDVRVCFRDSIHAVCRAPLSALHLHRSVTHAPDVELYSSTALYISTALEVSRYTKRPTKLDKRPRQVKTWKMCQRSRDGKNARPAPWIGIFGGEKSAAVPPLPRLVTLAARARLSFSMCFTMERERERERERES